MTHMTKTQAEALAAFISRVRPEWRPAGIVAACEKAAPTADVFDVARALLNLAADPTVLTPGLLDKPGPHWKRPDGSKPARRGDHNVKCADHTGFDMPCPHLDHHGQMTLDEIAEAKAAVLAELAAARTTTPAARREPAPLTEPAHRLEQVRALIPEETTHA